MYLLRVITIFLKIFIHLLLIYLEPLINNVRDIIVLTKN